MIDFNVSPVYGDMQEETSENRILNTKNSDSEKSLGDALVEFLKTINEGVEE